MCTNFSSNEKSDLPIRQYVCVKHRIVCANSSLIKYGSDVIQQWDLAYNCHSTITPIKNRSVCAGHNSQGLD